MNPSLDAYRDADIRRQELRAEAARTRLAAGACFIASPTSALRSANRVLAHALVALHSLAVVAIPGR
jgi:hypothetical protein